MKRKVADFIERHRLLRKDELHIVALSGGADSVALLSVLQQLGFRIEAAHCNFHLRGDESDRDEEFVRELCKQREITFHVIHFDTRLYADLHQVSIEMAARELRYSYFEQLRQDIDAADICVAHHRDDAVETLMMNLLRGTGIHGLTGIRRRNGHIVRPLLCVSRLEIEEFLHSIGQSYVTDSSNLIDDVVRNKLRLNILPLLQQVNPKASENIYKTALRLTEAERVFNIAMESAQKRVSTKSDNGWTIDIAALRQEPSPEYLLFEILSPMGFSPDTIEQISSHLDSQTGRSYLSPTHELLFDRGQMLIQEHQSPLPTLRIPETGTYIYGEHKLHISQSTNIEISREATIATLDAATVAFPLTLRPVSEADRFVPFGMTGSRLVSDFLTDRKMNLFDRRRQLVLTDATGAIVWLVALRTDNRFRVSSSTTSILRITLE